MTHDRSHVLSRALGGLAVVGLLTAGFAHPSHAAGTPVAAEPAGAATSTHASSSSASAHASTTNSARTDGANSGTASTASAAAPKEQGSGKLMLALDSSGSMAEPAGGGKSRIEAAREALHTAVDGLPSQAEVGMRVYGATVASKATDPEGACTDSQAVVSPGTDNRAKLRKQIDAYKPYGETPTGHALRKAGADLGSEGKRNIVLVSDGESNCQPDPCEVAAQLTKQGIDVTIDVVGFNVSGKAREQLRCVADSGNGTYYDADDAEDLKASIDKLSTRAFRPFEFTGKPLDLADSSTEASEIGGGQYATTLPGGGQDGYAVVRKKPGSSLWASITTKDPDDGLGSYSTVNLEVTTLEGENCSRSSNAEDGLSGQSKLFSASTLVDPLNESWDWENNGCKEADRLLLRVRNGDERDTDRAPLRSELVVVEEPVVPEGARKLLPGEDEEYAEHKHDYEPRWHPKGKANKTTGGTSFSNAKTLTPGTYADTILPGESLTYRVPLKHGQRAEFISRFATLGTAEQEAMQDGGMDVELDAYGPSRDHLFNDDTDVEGDANAIAGIQTPRVRYLNRDDQVHEMRGASMEGYYYFTVQARDQDTPVMVPFELDVRVTGKPSGQPAYAGGGQVIGPTGVTADSGSSDDSGDSQDPAESEGGSGPGSSGGVGDEGSKEGTAGGSEDDAAGFASWDGELTAVALPVGLGLLLVLAVVVALLLLRRPRDRTPRGPYGSA